MWLSFMPVTFRWLTTIPMPRSACLNGVRGWRVWRRPKFTDSLISCIAVSLLCNEVPESLRQHWPSVPTGWNCTRNLLSRKLWKYGGRLRLSRNRTIKLWLKKAKVCNLHQKVRETKLVPGKDGRRSRQPDSRPGNGPGIWDLGRIVHYLDSTRPCPGINQGPTTSTSVDAGPAIFKSRSNRESNI